MENKSFKHAVTKLGYQIIWSTKFRHPILTDEVEIELKHILAQTCVAYNWVMHELEIKPDYVHCFIQADHLTSPGEISKTLKNISAVKLFAVFPHLKQQKFWGTGLWSDSTYYGTVGDNREDIVREYVQSQKKKG